MSGSPCVAAPLSLGADWLPAVEQFGEGLFIHFDEQHLHRNRPLRLLLVRHQLRSLADYQLSHYQLCQLLCCRQPEHRFALRHHRRWRPNLHR